METVLGRSRVGTVAGVRFSYCVLLYTAQASPHSTYSKTHHAHRMRSLNCKAGVDPVILRHEGKLRQRLAWGHPGRKEEPEATARTLDSQPLLGSAACSNYIPCSWLSCHNWRFSKPSNYIELGGKLWFGIQVLTLEKYQLPCTTSALACYWGLLCMSLERLFSEHST